MTRPEPAVPADGTCAQCGRRRGVGAKNKAARAAAALDPFCRTECAKAWFGVPEYVSPPRRPTGYVSSRDRL